METITISGIKINPVLDPIDSIVEQLQSNTDDFRNKLIVGCKDFNEFVQSAHSLVYYDFKGSEVVAKMVHETLSNADRLVSDTRKVLLQREVSPDLLVAYADAIIELGDTIRDMMRKLGY